MLLRAQPQDDGPRRLPETVSSWSVRGQLFHLGRTLWEAGATPGAFVRSLGPWGPSLIQKYACNRCSHLPPCRTLVGCGFWADLVGAVDCGPAAHMGSFHSVSGHIA